MSDADDAQTLLERARALAETGRYGDAVRTFDAIIEHFGTSTDPSIEALVGDAFFWKAHSLHQVERDEDAVRVYDQMARRFSERADFRGLLSRALYQKATTLARLGRPEDALAVWEEMLATFADEDVPPLAMGLAFAYQGKGAALRLLDRPDEAIGVYDDLIVRFSDSDYPVLRGRADAALSEKVFVLLLGGHYDEAIVVADAAVGRLDESADPDALAIAVLNLGGALANEQRFDDAIGVYDALIERLGGTAMPLLRARVILATSNKAEALTALGRDAEADEVYAELLERFGDEVPAAFGDAAAQTEHEETAKAVVAGLLLKQVLALAELGHKPQARAAAENLMERFGAEDGPQFQHVVETARELRERLVDDED
ncbi:MAG TPA: tetratricopeptide repeat protein [Thermoleophilaceae bacterium]|nr:tetratricopeptide repeat protein [Thermoleophilaceae bacterium]